MIRYPNKTDLALRLNLSGFDKEAANPVAFSWTLELQTKGKKVRLEHTAGQASAESKGDIPCGCTLEAGIIHLYAKSSEVPFGEGKLLCRMKMEFDNERFPDGKQVLRILAAQTAKPGEFEIETNITII